MGSKCSLLSAEGDVFNNCFIDRTFGSLLVSDTFWLGMFLGFQNNSGELLRHQVAPVGSSNIDLVTFGGRRQRTPDRSGQRATLDVLELYFAQLLKYLEFLEARIAAASPFSHHDRE